MRASLDDARCEPYAGWPGRVVMIKHRLYTWSTDAVIAFQNVLSVRLLSRIATHLVTCYRTRPFTVQKNRVCRYIAT